MMETHRLLIILIVYVLCAASGYPPRPLNERSPDLTWQAWLLVDDQNQNRQQQQQQQGNPDGTLRRRITPKSVFIAPTFSPDSFPACADGYSSDPMGRCVKIIKLDQDAHYEFLIEKLKQKFSSLDYEDDDEEEEEQQEVVAPTTGPLQLNIPLNIDGEDLRSEESSRETDVAIIVSPTKPGFDFESYNFDKRDSSGGDEADQEALLKKLNEATTKTQRETVTVTAQSTTTVNPTEPVTTTTDPTTTTEEPPTTTTQDYPTTLTEESTPTTEITVTTTTDSTTTTTFTDSTTNIVTQSPKPDDPNFVEELHSMKHNLTTLPPSETGRGFVRFPDEAPVRRVKFPDSRVPSSLDHIASMNDNERTVIVDSQREFDRGFPDGNFRKRDDHKGLFMIPPRWNPSSFQKPLVLRFSRKHAFIDKNQFNYPNYYRSIPPDDFEYLFKFKNRQ